MVRDSYNMAARVKHSGVWDYFAVNVTDDSKVSCLVCEASIPRGGKEAMSYNTSNMRHHLETKHQDEYTTLIAKEKELAKEKESGKTSCVSNAQPTLFESLFKMQPFSLDHPRTKAIAKQLGEIIALDSAPFFALYIILVLQD